MGLYSGCRVGADDRETKRMVPTSMNGSAACEPGEKRTTQHVGAESSSLQDRQVGDVVVEEMGS